MMENDGKGKRYAIHKGRIHLGGKYKIGEQVATTDHFIVARRDAYRLFREGVNVLIIDRRMGAIVGNLWMIATEIVK
jgi:hypothetical protein